MKSTNEEVSSGVIPEGFIAVLRGVKPDQVEQVGKALFGLGFGTIEVTLNSPEPYTSIEILREKLPPSCLVGAGTVTQVEEVLKVKASGGSFIVSPNLNPEVVKVSLANGLMSIPGCYTPSEIFTAISLGAKYIKLFPARSYGVKGYQDLKAVLPQGICLIPMGGVSKHNLPDYLAKGCRLFGVGSDLYKADKPLEKIIQDGKNLIALFNQAQSD